LRLVESQPVCSGMVLVPTGQPDGASTSQGAASTSTTARQPRP
jgi:hypothetical protein